MSSLSEKLLNLTLEPPREAIDKARKKDLFFIPIASAILCGFFVSPSIVHFSNLVVKWLFIFSFLFVLCGEFLLIWHYFRIKKRLERLEAMAAETSDFVAQVTDEILEKYVVPLARYDERELIGEILKNAKTAEEAKRLIEQRKIDLENSEAEKRPIDDGYLLNGLLALLMATANHRDHRMALHRPLNEKYALLRYRIDRIADNARLGVFYFGSVLAAVSTLLDLISK